MAAFAVLALSTAAANAAAPPAQTLMLDAAAPGKVFEGVGAVSGGGATSVLLKDYPQLQREQVLDLLFKPKFAASMQALYVEVGGDGNSTQGSEPTHMRSPHDLNFGRGYEWWLMTEANHRNPALTLDACAWSCPYWVGDGTYWSQDMCDYYAAWINGLKATYGLDLEAVGCRNEWGANTEWVKRFRRTLDANRLNAVRIHAFDNPGAPWSWQWVPQLATDPELAAAVAIVGNHTSTLSPPSPTTRAVIDRLGKPTWDTEEHVYDGDGRHYADDWGAAIGAVHLFNDNFLSVGATKIINWYLVGSTYGIEPYADQPPAMIARSPWSGHYALKPIMWAYAHYGQFTHVGWRYVSGGCAKLDGGGTVITMRSPAGGDYSVIAETAGATVPQTVTLKLGAGLSNRPLCIWRTTRAEQFIRLPDIAPAGQSVTVTLDPDAMYSLSTTTGQQKGMFADVPADRPFPFPYFDDFNHYGDAKRWGYLPHYTADICGGFELADRPDHKGGCLRQVVGRKPQSWAPEWMPYTILGDAAWADYDVSADVYFDDGGWAGVMGRVGRTGDGWNGNPDGYYARLYPDGGCALYVASHELRGSHDQQLAVGQVGQWKSGGWHNLKLRFEGKAISVLVDGQPVLSVHDDRFAHGMAGLVCGGEGSSRNTALFDNLLVCPVGGTAPGSTPVTASPMYEH